MSKRHWVGVLLAAAVAAGADGPDPGGILRQLGSREFAEREAGQRALAGVGAEGMERLQDLADETGDAEVRARVLARVGELAGERLRMREGNEAAPITYALRGGVVDSQGRPAAHARVMARGWHLGGMTRGLLGPVLTDGAGRYEVRVPARDILYHITVNVPGHREESRVVLFDGQGLGAWGVGPAEGIVRRMATGVLLDGRGEAVSGARVQVVGQYWHRVETETDRAGRFEADLTGLGQAVMYVRVGEEVTPGEMARPGKDMQVRLVKAGAVAGRVIDKGTGQPVPHARVRARPTFLTDFCLEGETDAGGRYRVAGVPPGKWRVVAEGPGHFDQVLSGAEEMEVRAGETATVNKELERKAAVVGRVVDAVGKGVARAGVMVMDRQGFDGLAREAYAVTDEGGRFLLGTGLVGQGAEVVAFSETGGRAQVMIGPVEPGRAEAGVRLRLPGVVRVKGRVVNEGGEPVAGVSCGAGPSWWTTGADGGFDLGNVSRDVGMEVKIYPPRPRTPAAGNTFEEARKSAYYLRQAVQGEERNGVMEVQVELKRAPLMEVRGRVVDRQGKGVADAGVYLFAGEGVDPLWPNGMRAFDGPHPIPAMPKQPVVIIGFAQTDAEGRYRLWAVREDGALEAQAEEINWERYCVGALAREASQHGVTKNVSVPETGRVDVDVTLGTE